MKTQETIYLNSQNNTINLIQAKVSQNSKIGIGYIVQTYHFSVDQVLNADFTKDAANCLSCPMSYTNNGGKSGGCYTHKGLQLMGLKSMLKRLNRLFLAGDIKEFNPSQIDIFTQKVKNTYKVDLIRFGAYGEPVLLGEEVTEKLTTLTKNFTGYTHTYKNQKNKWSNKYFMASVHNEIDLQVAKFFKFRSFIAKDAEMSADGVNCPASKESTLNLSCIKCKLCNGTATSIKKDVYINIH